MLFALIKKISLISVSSVHAESSINKIEITPSESELLKREPPTPSQEQMVKPKGILKKEESGQDGKSVNFGKEARVYILERYSLCSLFPHLCDMHPRAEKDKDKEKPAPGSKEESKKTQDAEEDGDKTKTDKLPPNVYKKRGSR